MTEKTLIISDSCIGCGQCVKVCIRGHLHVGDDGKVHETDSLYSCFRCGHCLAVCPKDAVRLKDSAEDPVPAGVSPVTPADLSLLLRIRRSMRWFDRNCTEEEIKSVLSAAGYAPTAENSQKISFAVVDRRFSEFMELLASILKEHTDEHPRIEQFVRYVENGQKEKNNPFTWEGRQLIIIFSRLPIDAAITAEQIDLAAFAAGLGGFHSRWMLLASEHDPERFMSFFPEIEDGLAAHAVYVTGHPRIRFRRTVPRDERRILWMRVRAFSAFQITGSGRLLNISG